VLTFPADVSLHFEILRGRVRRTYRVEIIPFLFVVMTPSTPDEVSLYYRNRLVAVLNADGEVHLDTHHNRGRAIIRLYNRILLDNGYDARMGMRGTGSFRDMALVRPDGSDIQRSVRMATFRPDGPIEAHA
jgi:hypothetical protein